MAVITVSNTGGDWSSPATWVGGVIPNATLDTVAFTAASGPLKINVASTCIGIDFTNYINEITFTALLTVNGPVNLGTGGYTQSGASGIQVNTTATHTSSNVTWSRLWTFGGTSQTYSMAGTWTFTGALNFSATTAMNLTGSTINTSNLTVTTIATVSGSTIRFNGTGTWSHSAAGYIQNNIVINTTGVLTLGANIYYQTGTLTYNNIGGTVNTTTNSNTLTIGGSCTLETQGITWNNIAVHNGTIQLTLNNNFNVNNFYATGIGGALTLTFNGLGLFNPTNAFVVSNVNATTVATITITLPNDISISTFNYPAQIGTSAKRNVVLNGNKNITLTGSSCNIDIQYGMGATISGNCTLIFAGTGNFALYTGGTYSLGAFSLPTIINTSGTCAFLTRFQDSNASYPIFTNTTFTYLQGTVTISGAGTNAVVFSGCTLNLSGGDWPLFTYIVGATTLTSNATFTNTLATATTAVTFSGAYTINAKGDLTISIATSGVNTPIILNGTGNQTWSHSSAVYLSNNLTIQKPSGILTIGANVYYNTGLLKYLSADSVNTTTNSSNLFINSACTLETNPIVWYNLNTSFTGNITLNTNLTWSNIWSVTAGSPVFVGSGALTPVSTSKLSFTGSSAVTTPGTVTNFDLDTITITTSGTTTLTGDLTALGTTTLSGVINGVGYRINAKGNLTISGSTSGSVSIYINGSTTQTWTSSSWLYNPLVINKSLNSTLNIGTTYCPPGGNFTYQAGNVVTTGTLYVRGSCTFATQGMNWNDVQLYAVQTDGVNYLSIYMTLTNNFSFVGNMTFQLPTYGTIIQISGAGGIDSPLGRIYLYLAGGGPTRYNLPSTVNILDFNFSTSVVGNYYNMTVNFLEPNFSITIPNTVTMNVNRNFISGGSGSGRLRFGGVVNMVGTGSVTMDKSTSTTSFNINTNGTITFSPSTLYYDYGDISYIKGDVITTNSLLCLGIITTGPGSLYSGDNNRSININTSNGEIDILTGLPKFIQWNSIYLYALTNYVVPVNITSNLKCNIFRFAGTTSPAFNSSNNSVAEISNNLIIESSGSTYGTGGLKMIGTGSWTHTTAVSLGNNLTFESGVNTITLGTNVYYNTGLLKYNNGTISNGSSTLNVTGTSSFDTTNMSWNNVIFTGTAPTYTFVSNFNTNGLLTFNPTTSATLTNNAINVKGNLTFSGTSTIQGTSEIIINGTGNQTWSHSTGYLTTNLTLNKATGTLILPANLYYKTNTFKYINSGGIIDFNTNNAVINVNGATIFDVNNLDLKNLTCTASAAYNVTLKSDMNITGVFKSYGVTGTINNATGKIIFLSDVSGTQRKLTLKPGAKSSVKYTGATDINSNDGQTVYSFRGGPLTNTLNWQAVNDLYFINGGTNTNYSNGTNWAVYSGGASVDLIPDATTNTYFDINSTQNCTVDVASVSASLNFSTYPNTRNIAFNNTLTSSGNVTLGANSETFTSTNGLVVNTTSILTSNNYEFSAPLTLNSALTHTLVGNWVNNAVVNLNGGTGTTITINTNDASSLIFKGGLIVNMMNGLVIGTTKFIFRNGTWEQANNWGVDGTLPSIIRNNIDIAPQTGETLTIGTVARIFVNVSSNTINYINNGGTVSMPTTSWLRISGTICNLNLNTLTLTNVWFAANGNVNANNTTAVNYQLLSNLNISTTLKFTSGTLTNPIAFSGSGQLNLNSIAKLLLVPREWQFNGGNCIVNFPGTYDLNIGDLHCYTTGDRNWTITNGSFAINVYGNVLFENATINTNGNQTDWQSANISKLILKGSNNRTWRHTTVPVGGQPNNKQYIRLEGNLIIDTLGTTTITDNHMYFGGTLEYIQGNIVSAVTGLGLYCPSINTTLNTKNLFWPSVYFVSVSTVTFLSDLNVERNLEVYSTSTTNLNSTNNIKIFSTNYYTQSGANITTNISNNIELTVENFKSEITIPNGAAVIINGNINILKSFNPIGTNYINHGFEGTGSINLIGGNVVVDCPNISISKALNIDTSGLVTILNNYYMGRAQNVITSATINNIRGKIDAKKATLYISRGDSSTVYYNLFGMNKVNWKNVIINSTSGNTYILMDEFFNGLPNQKTNIYSGNGSNYIINFTNQFEKLAKFVNISNCTIATNNKLLIITDDKKSLNTNSGNIRYINTMPNGVAREENFKTLGETSFNTNFLLTDPAMTMK